MAGTAHIAASPPNRHRRLEMTPSRREAAWGYGFIGIWLIGFVIFTAGPLLASFLISFTNFDLGHPETWAFVGLDNYKTALSDPNVRQGLLVTLKFGLIAIPLTMGASLGVALLVNHQNLTGRPLFRTLFFMPIQIPLVAGTLVWLGFLNTNTGWLNGILGMVGIEGPDWINTDPTILASLSLIGLWAIGNFMIINIAGLQSIPTELYEAAKIDGATGWKAFRRITIPLLSPVLLYDLVISLIGASQYFTQAYVLSNGRGEPNNATLFINLDLYREAFTYNHMGYATAIAWILFAIVLVIALLIFAYARDRVYYAGADR